MTKTTITMGRLASITFGLCVLILVFTEAEGQQCENGWFGDKCQYQCHCLYDAICDKTTGDCPGDCDRPWFGPQCQYRDAAYNSLVSLTDGVDSTCLVGSQLSQDFPMLDDVVFTWMRIVTNEPGFFDRVNIKFISSSESEVVPNSELTTTFVTDTIIELYGELEERFRTIRLKFDSVPTRMSFCTMQVSSGRNVAIKQRTSQTSTYEGGAEKAVDGTFSQVWNKSSCSSTEQDNNPYLALNLSMPVTVNMYTIIGSTDWWVLCRLRYFRLESYNRSTKVQQYDETASIDVYSYVYSEDTSPITSVTLTVSRDRWPNKYIDCDNNRISLSFCEMQIFGDVVCKPGKWGRDCEKDCNCQDPSESCFVSTGMCPSGCKAGFHGPGCQKECIDGRWGVDCMKWCGRCFNGNCDKRSGECPSGCVPGYKTPYCVEECDPYFYGYNCSQTCPTNCLNNICDNVDGTCTKCVAGYQGPMCNQACDHTTYGEGCNKNCSVNCVVNATQEPAVCEHVNGQCLLGCVSGYSGMTCEEIPRDALNPVTIVVPIILVLIVIAALITGICLWRKRKAQRTGGRPVVNTEKEIGPDVAHERGVRLKMKNQQSREQDTVDQNYENMSPYEIEEDPGLNVYDKISPSMKRKDNQPFNEFEKTGVNRDSTSNVYKEPEKDD